MSTLQIQLFLEHFKETVGITTDVARNINTKEIAQQLDKFVYEYIFEMTAVQIVGAYLAAMHVVATFEEVGCRIECQYGNSWNGSVLYVRFLEILNNWAGVMEHKIIIDLLYDPYSIYDCGNKSDSSYYCGCGFWTRDKRSGKFFDRKSCKISINKI